MRACPLEPRRRRGKTPLTALRTALKATNQTDTPPSRTREGGCAASLFQAFCGRIRKASLPACLNGTRRQARGAQADQNGSAEGLRMREAVRKIRETAADACAPLLLRARLWKETRRIG